MVDEPVPRKRGGLVPRDVDDVRDLELAQRLPICATHTTASLSMAAKRNRSAPRSSPLAWFLFPRKSRLTTCGRAIASDRGAAAHGKHAARVRRACGARTDLGRADFLRGADGAAPFRIGPAGGGARPCDTLRRGGRPTAQWKPRSKGIRARSMMKSKSRLHPCQQLALQPNGFR
jgi:hypothetical protein